MYLLFLDLKLSLLSLELGLFLFAVLALVVHVDLLFSGLCEQVGSESGVACEQEVENN